MEKLKIDIPKGFEIDLEASDLLEGVVRFKPKKVKLDYGKVVKALFGVNNTYYTDSIGNIREGSSTVGLEDPNTATSREQLECLMAHNKLRNVAEYLGIKDGIEIHINPFLVLKAIEILGEDEFKKALFINI